MLGEHNVNMTSVTFLLMNTHGRFGREKRTRKLELFFDVKILGANRGRYIFTATIFLEYRCPNVNVITPTCRVTLVGATIGDIIYIWTLGFFFCYVFARRIVATIIFKCTSVIHVDLEDVVAQ